jgi:condensin complex subunit 1
MDSSHVQIDLNDSLKYYLSDPTTVPTPEAHSSLIDCENDPDALTVPLVNSVLNPIVDSVAETPEAITRSSSFDSLQFLLKCAPISLACQQNYPGKPDSELFSLSRSTSVLPTHALSKILDLVVSGLSAEADIIHNDSETEEQEAVTHHRNLLEAYGFLLQWTVAAVETKAQEKTAAAPLAKARGGAGKGAKSRSGAKDGAWDSSAQLQTALEVMCKVLKLKLSRIFVTTSERDTFVNLCTRPVYLVLESEQRAKSTAIRMHAFKVLCIAVKHHGHAFGMEPSVLMESLIAADTHGGQVLRHPSYRISRTSSISRSPWPSFYIFSPSNTTTLNSQMKFSGSSATRSSIPTTAGVPSQSRPSSSSSPSSLLGW